MLKKTPKNPDRVMQDPNAKPHNNDWLAIHCTAYYAIKIYIICHKILGFKWNDLKMSSLLSLKKKKSLWLDCKGLTFLGLAWRMVRRGERDFFWNADVSVLVHQYNSCRPLATTPSGNTTQKKHVRKILGYV